MEHEHRVEDCAQHKSILPRKTSHVAFGALSFCINGTRSHAGQNKGGKVENAGKICLG